MKIGKLNQHCGDCSIMDFCGNSFGFCVCTMECFANVDEEKYKEIAENAETLPYCKCVGCDKNDCESCDHEDDSRDHYCEQVADKVKEVLELS